MAWLQKARSIVVSGSMGCMPERNSMKLALLKLVLLKLAFGRYVFNDALGSWYLFLYAKANASEFLIKRADSFV